MNILDKIVAQKKIEVVQAQQQASIQQLENKILFQRHTVSLTHNLLKENSTGIISEFKRKSPSKGIINNKS
mgnify:FL=1